MIATFPRSWLSAAVQLSLATAALGGSIAIPPAEGAMLLVPLTPGSLGDVLTLATDRGALLLANGPTGGTAIIRGERRRLLAPLLARGVLVTAAPARWCGA